MDFACNSCNSCNPQELTKNGQFQVIQNQKNMLITNTFYNVSAYSGKEYFKASNEE